MPDRKYRQSGYQDSGGTDTGSPKRPKRAQKEGPRGRGLGARTVSVLKCSRCGTKMSAAPSALDVCKDCGADLHTCTNCKHFDSSAPKECRQPIGTRIAAKAKANDCEFFEPKALQEFAPSTPGGSAADAKTAFDDLFDF